MLAARPKKLGQAWAVGQLKVSLFRNVFLILSILPKNELEIIIFALVYWDRNLSIDFLVNLKKSKRHSEIN